jgi:hypothetical protein
METFLLFLFCGGATPSDPTTHIENAFSTTNLPKPFKNGARSCKIIIHYL